MVNARTFANVGLLSEALLHECLHQKMADIRIVTTMLAPSYREQLSLQNREVLVPWPDAASPRFWSVARCLAAFHVYVHLALFYVAGSRVPPPGELPAQWPGMATSRFATCFRRAEYLGGCLDTIVGEKALGVEGRQFRDELKGALRKLECFDSAGVRSLELLDRYRLHS